MVRLIAEEELVPALEEASDTDSEDEVAVVGLPMKKPARGVWPNERCPG